MTEYILEINSVTKTFGGLKAVDSAEFKLKNKEILGLIDPMVQEKLPFLMLSVDTMLQVPVK